MVSFLAVVKILSFWHKTMDYVYTCICMLVLSVHSIVESYRPDVCHLGGGACL